MLQGFTWMQFGFFIGGALALYYLWLMGSGKMGSKAKRRQTPGPPIYSPPEADKKRVWRVEEQEPEGVEVDNDEDHEPTAEEEKEERIFETLESLANDVHRIIADAGEGADKQTLLLDLRKEIAAYPELNKPAFRMAVQNVIMRSAKRECNIDVSAEEAEALWLDLG